MFICNIFYIGMSSRRRSTHSGSPSSSQRETARQTSGGDGGGPSQPVVRPVVWLKPKADGR